MIVRRSVRAALGLGLALALLAGCSSTKTDDSAGGSGASSSQGGSATTVAAQPFRILVTNDDGYDADGIDAVVEALRALPNVEVTVVAPATNQSGTGGKTTDGPLTVTDVKTKSGYAAKAVAGYPADTIIWAIDQKGIDFRPDLVVSGINFGQNVGPLTDISGTVGAARAAASRGLPALAASQGLGDPVDYPAGVKQVLAWFDQHQAALVTAAASPTSGPLTVDNLNVPSCNATGSVRGQVDVPTATTDDGQNLLATQDCASTATNPPDDVTAFFEGFAPLSVLQATP